MILLKKETVHNPLEYLGLSHAALAEKHGGRSPAAYSINCCVVKIFQMFLAVCVNFFRNQRTDRPSAVFLFCEKLFVNIIHYASKQSYLLGFVPQPNLRTCDQNPKLIYDELLKEFAKLD